MVHVVAQSLPWRSEGASAEALAEVFAGLKKGLQEKNVKECLVACRKLTGFLELKGELSLEDRSALAKLLFDWLFMEQTSTYTQIKVMKTLKTLLEKRYVGLKVDVDWKQLWSLVKATHLRRDKSSEVASSQVRSSHAAALTDLAKVTRKYFDETVIDQVCQEAREYMQDPLSQDLFIGQTILVLFLPACQSRKYTPHLKQWVYEDWSLVEHCAEWDASWLYIVRRALKWGGVECIDNDLLKKLSQKVVAGLRLASPSGFNVPTRTSRPAYLRGFATKTQANDSAARIAIHLIGCGSAEDFFDVPAGFEDRLTPNSQEELKECLDVNKNLSAGMLYLRRLLSSVQTLFHPSNSSHHANTVVSFAEGLCCSFSRRLGRERCPEKYGPFPKMTSEDKATLVDSLLPLITMAFYSKNRSIQHAAQSCLGHLAFVSPIRVSEHFLPLIMDALDPSNLNQTHQAPAAIRMLSVLIQPLLQVRPLLAEALPTLLELTLPGIDPNDVTKTMTTCMFYQVVLSWIPIIDVSDLDFPTGASFPSNDLSFSQSYGIDGEEKEARYDDATFRDAMWRSSPVLVDWSLECLNRILRYIENQVQRAKGGLAEHLDNAVYSSMGLLGRLLVAQMCPSVLRKAGTKINEWALSTVNLDALRESKTLIRCYASSVVSSQSPETIRELLMSGLFEPLLSLALNKETSSRKLEWALVLLGAIVRVTGPFLLEYEKELNQIIDTCLEHEEAKIRKLGGKIIRRAMRGAAEYFVPSRASTSALETRDPKQLAVAAVSWAQPVAWTATCSDVGWHFPSEAELAFAKRFRDKYLASSLEEIDDAISKSKPTTVLRAKLEILFQVVRGMACFTTERVERGKVLQRVCKALPWLLEHRESDTISHRRCIKVMRILLTCFGANTSTHSKLKGRKLWFAYMREMMSSEAYVSELRAACKQGLVEDRKDWVVPRFHQLDEVQTLLQKQEYELSFSRAREAKDDDDEGNLEHCFDVLTMANSHDWSDTRKAAQGALKDLMSKSPWFGKSRVKSIISRLVAHDEKSHGQVLGASYLIGWNKIIRWIAGDWFLLDKFARVVLFETSEGIKKLPEDKQKEVNESLQKAIIQVLNGWTGLSHNALRSDEEQLRVALLNDMTDVTNTSSLTWKQQIIVCVLLIVLAKPDDDSALESPMLQWVFSRVFSEMLPVRTAAISVLVQLLLRVPEKKRDVVVKRLGLNELDAGDGADRSFFRTVCEVFAQNHSNATTSVDGNTKGIKQRAEWSAGVGELLRLSRFPGSKFEIRTNVPSNAKDFLSSHKVLIAKLSKVLGPDLATKAFLPHLKFFLFENEHMAEHASKVCAASEVFSGLLTESSSAELMDVGNEKFFDSSIESADVWLDAYRLADNAKIHVQALELFLGKLEEALADKNSMSQAVVACNVLRMVRVLGYELEGEEALKKTVALVDICLKALDHPYENVRREMGRSLAALVDLHERRAVAGRESWIKDLLQSISSATENQPREEDSSPATRTLETALHFYVSLVLVGGQAKEKYLASAFSVVLQAQGHPNAEASKLARSAAACVGSAHFQTQEAGIHAVNQAADVGLAQEENWYARQTMGKVLATLLIINAATLGYSVGAIHCRKEIEKLLRDQQVEVQNTASVVLTQVLSGYVETSPSLSVTKDRYLKLAKTKLKRDQFKTEEGKEKLKKRMTGVLGLAAVVHAFPYTVPFPDAVVALAKRVSDPSPVGPGAKQAVQSFKHTHTDTWEQAKKHFTSDELEDLQDSSYSGSHA